MDSEFTSIANLVREEIRSRLGETIEAPQDSAGPVVRADVNGAKLIDHTLLKPDATRAAIVKLCGEAREHGFASACVNPYWTALAAAELEGSGVAVCTVVGFPLGATLPQVKAFETAAALHLGATEIDMVINIGALCGGEYEAVRADIRGVVETARAAGAIVKVILETALLTDVQKGVACVLAKSAGADFVKTSTGFGPGGATAHDVALMRAIVGRQMGVKASGGIRTPEDFNAMIAAGANRIGASAGIKLIGTSAAVSASAAARPASEY